jgi:hypothetical protein
VKSHRGISEEKKKISPPTRPFLDDVCMAYATNERSIEPADTSQVERGSRKASACLTQPVGRAVRASRVERAARDVFGQVSFLIPRVNFKKPSYLHEKYLNHRYSAKLQKTTGFARIRSNVQ